MDLFGAHQLLSVIWASHPTQAVGVSPQKLPKNYGKTGASKHATSYTPYTQPLQEMYYLWIEPNRKSEIVKIDLQVISGVIQLIVGEVCARMPISHFLRSVIVLNVVTCKACVQFPGKFCSFISFGREFKKCCLSATCEAKWQVREVSGHYVGTTLITWLGKQNVHMRLVAGGGGGERGGGGGTIQGRAIFFSHMLIETGALLNIEHYSREGSNRESTVILLFCSYTNKHAPGIS